MTDWRCQPEEGCCSRQLKHPLRLLELLGLGTSQISHLSGIHQGSVGVLSFFPWRVLLEERTRPGVRDALFSPRIVTGISSIMNSVRRRRTPSFNTDSGSFSERVCVCVSLGSHQIHVLPKTQTCVMVHTCEFACWLKMQRCVLITHKHRLEPRLCASCDEGNLSPLCKRCQSSDRQQIQFVELSCWGG